MQIKLIKASNDWYIEIDGNGNFLPCDGTTSKLLTGFDCPYDDSYQGIFTSMRRGQIVFSLGCHRFSLVLDRWEPDIWNNPAQDLVERILLVKKAFEDSVSEVYTAEL